MSEADRLFEELGYIKYDNHPEEEKKEINKWATQDCRVIEYIQQGTIKGMFYTLFIRFHIEGKVVEIGASERREGYRELGRYRNPILNMEEIKAINLKCKELGWIEECYYEENNNKKIRKCRYKKCKRKCYERRFIK